MMGVSERLSAEFYRWEREGRGYTLWPAPVELEPVVRSPEVAAPPVDDGRRPTFFSNVVRGISEFLSPTDPRPAAESSEHEATARPNKRGDLEEWQLVLLSGQRLDRADYSSLFTALAVAAEPIAFEIIATGSRIVVQFAVSPRDAGLLRHQVAAFAPEAPLVSAAGYLGNTWGALGAAPSAIVDFGLGKEFMVPLAPRGGDPFVALMGALSTLREGEVAALQVLFTPVEAPWHDWIVRSVSHADGSARFVNAPELLPGAREKASWPLFAAVARIASRVDEAERAWEIACDIGGALGVLGSVSGNELVPLHNEGYPIEDHEADFLARQSRRSGMILNSLELAGLVHLPSPDVRAPRLRMLAVRSKAAPSKVVREDGARLGLNVHAGVSRSVTLTREDRSRHVHIIGASGTGKSSLLYSLIMQDITAGEGLSVLDPHGDLIDRILGSIPQQRMADVVLLDPSDSDYVVGFNVLTAHGEWEKNMLASDLVAVFRRLSTSWGDQLNSVFQNAILAFLESSRGGTLHDVRRFLLEAGYRNEFLTTVRDPDVVYYWRKAFPALTGNKSVGPIVTRLDTFLSPKPIRYMVAHGENRLDFRDIMDTGKIFLAKLSQGALGRDNSHLLGSLLVAKIQAEAMSRQRQTESARRHHWLYADEFHEFLTPSLAECLTGARKYRLGLVLAHQEMRQVERDADVASALLNAYTRVVFRVNDRDSRTLEGGFSDFSASDIQNLPTGHAICRVERADHDFNLVVPAPEYRENAETEANRRGAVECSRKRYASSRAIVEEALRKVPRESEEEKDVRSERPTVPRPSPTALAEKPAPCAPPPVKEAVPPATDLGKGGAQHKAIQERVKEAAEKLGYRVIVEQDAAGLGQIDLVLSRGTEAIACEVTVTGTIDYEVGNVSKCFKAGFTRVAVIAVTEEKLAKLSSAVLNSLGRERAENVRYFLPEKFLESLGSAPKGEPPEPVPVRTRGGRTVKRTVVALSSSEAKAREEQGLQLMAELMRTKKGK